MTVLNHVCLPVLDLTRSASFYQEALGLTLQRELWIRDHTHHLYFLSDPTTEFQLELDQQVPDTPPLSPSQGVHLGIRTDEFDLLHSRHRAMGCITEELTELGIYFIQDPDGHSIEIVPLRS